MKSNLSAVQCVLQVINEDNSKIMKKRVSINDATAVLITNLLDVCRRTSYQTYID